MKMIRTSYDDGEQRLWYTQQEPGLWRFFHQVGHEEPVPVGPVYRTRALLLADADRYARDFGFEVRSSVEQELRDRLNHITADFEELQRCYNDLLEKCR